VFTSVTCNLEDRLIVDSRDEVIIKTNEFVQLGDCIDGISGGDVFGSSLSMNSLGDRIVVGAPFSEVNGSDTGQVRVFGYTGNNWVQVGQTLNDNNIIDIRYGGSVDINNSGDRIVVGNRYQADAFPANQQIVRVYEYNGSTWNQLGNDITRLLNISLSGFGFSVAINNVGDIVAIGSPGLLLGGGFAVEIYQYNGSNWNILGNTITAQNPGLSVDINDSGTRVSIASETSFVQIYEFNGSTWVQLGSNLTIDFDSNTNGLYKLVCLNGAGDRVVIGNPTILNFSNGFVEIFEFNGTDWVQLGNTIEGALPTGNLGCSVDINTAGDRIVAGACRADVNGTNSGTTKVFEYDGTRWNEIFSMINGSTGGDFNGFCVGINNLGDRVASGIPNADPNGRTSSGQVKVYNEIDKVIKTPFRSTLNSLNPIAIGTQVGQTGQQINSIAIGNQAGQSNQESGAVAIGLQAGEISQQPNSIAIGTQAGQTGQQLNSIAIGNQAGQSSAPELSILIGIKAGNTSIGGVNSNISIGNSAGEVNQNTNGIAIGPQAGNFIQRNNCVAIGSNAGNMNQGTNNGFAVAIGSQAGEISQEEFAVAIGNRSGEMMQGRTAVAIGTQAGETMQGDFSVAIGRLAANSDQGINSVAIGNFAGQISQGAESVAVGINAGFSGQGLCAVAVGDRAGRLNQGNDAVAIGNGAGNTNQGDFSVCIGEEAGTLNAPNNSIIINATGSALNVTTQGFFVKPVRDVLVGTTGVMIYDPSDGEIRYIPTKTFVIDHPVNPDKYLVHACLEGPEAGVYYRGESEIPQGKDSIEVDLPDYVDALATDFTVHVTSICEGKPALIGASRVKNNKFTVYGDPGPFSWIVYGKRGDVDVEPDKDSVDVRGDGPYKYINGYKK